jgi:misacylated tRNA(Ala) deacylase
MTQRLYLDDAYLRECDAKVVRADGARVVLDRTVLYAESGGQAPDHGALRWNGGEARVLDSQIEGGGHVGDIVHTLEGTAPPPGTPVRVEIDWPRRSGLMRHHTAAHVIAAILHHEFHATFTGGQLYPDRARIDVQFEAWDPAIPARIGARANEESAKGYEVRNYEISREEFEKGDLLRTAEDLVDPALTRIRMTDIVGLDAQADGGTHVRNTREVGRIVMGKADNKGKGHRRLSYSCEAGAP